MIRFKFEETIDRPAGEIWAYAADIPRHPQWMNVSDARILSGDGTEVGARALEGMRLGPRRLQVELEVSAADPGRRIAWRALRGGPFRADVGLDLEALEPNRTHVTYSGNLGLIGLWRLLEPLMAAEAKTSGADELQKLKAILESGRRRRARL